MITVRLLNWNIKYFMSELNSNYIDYYNCYWYTKWDSSPYCNNKF